MLKVVPGTVSHQKNLAIFKYTCTEWEGTSRLTDQNEQKSRNRKIQDMLRNDKRFSKPVLMGVIGRYCQF